MKISTIFLVFALTLAAPAAHAEQQRRFYASDGRSVGTAVPLGDGSVRYFHARGNSVGASSTTGNGTTFYDARGNITGRASTPLRSGSER